MEAQASPITELPRSPTPFTVNVEFVDEISTIPRRLRSKLIEMGVSIGLPEIEKKFESQDGTVRYLMAFGDGQTVETVWMPEGDDGETGDGTEAGEAARILTRMGPCHDLPLQPGRLRCGLSLLPDCFARGEAKSDRG